MTVAGDETEDDRRLAEAVHLQAIEGNPLSPEELAMFETFEREGWPAEDRRAWIERRLGERRRDLGAALSMPGLADIDFDPPRLDIGAVSPDLS